MPSLTDEDDFLQDFPPGPLDVYRKQASFDWKVMKLVVESEKVLRFKSESGVQQLIISDLKMGVSMGKPYDSRNLPQCAGEMVEDGRVASVDFEYDFDLFIVGGGSGGLATAKRAAKLGKRVALCDYVKPSPIGTTWGLGGTCVNVGCIPKKLMHQAALLGLAINDSSSFGWGIEKDSVDHDWAKMRKAIQNYIHSLNWGYKATLLADKVEYFHAFAVFEDTHTVLLTEDKKEEPRRVTSEHFIISVGGRPRYLEIPGGLAEDALCITSDDLFSLRNHPGKVLLIGASYVSLECAGFLAGIGVDTSIMVRSIFLRGFDQQMAELIGTTLDEHGVRILRGWVPIKIEKVEDGSSHRLMIAYENTTTKEVMEEMFDTIVLAVGRDPCTPALQLENIGVDLHPENLKILTNEEERTSVENIFAIGDVANNRPELTPAAIQAGVLLVDRLYGGKTALVDYINVATCVFTPVEYGCVGYAEEDAIEEFGIENLETYHLSFQPLEFTVPSRDKSTCYSKLICLKTDSERIIGFHYLGPNAGEVTQGFALALRLKATKFDVDSTIGIHPTCAEVFTHMNITKASGLEWQENELLKLSFVLD